VPDPEIQYQQQERDCQEKAGKSQLPDTVADRYGQKGFFFIPAQPIGAAVSGRE